MSTSTYSKKKAILVFQFLIMLGAFTYIIYLVNWHQAAIVFRQAHLAWLSLALCFALISLIPAALRWISLLKAANVVYSFLAAYRAYLSAMFVSVVMPGVIGGDVARIWLSVRDTKATTLLATTTILLERALGVAVLLLILTIGIYLSHFKTDNHFFSWVPVLAVFGICSIAVIPRIIRWITQEKKSTKSFSILIKLKQQLIPFQSIRINTLYFAFLLSFLFQSFDIFVSFFVAKALGYQLSMTNLMVALPIAYLITVLPLSPGGFGVREVTFVAILTLFGMSATQAALLALAIFLNRVLVGIIGGINFASDFASFRKATDKNHQPAAV